MVSIGEGTRGAINSLAIFKTQRDAPVSVSGDSRARLHLCARTYRNSFYLLADGEP